MRCKPGHRFVSGDKSHNIPLNDVFGFDFGVRKSVRSAIHFVPEFLY